MQSQESDRHPQINTVRETLQNLLKFYLTVIGTIAIVFIIYILLMKYLFKPKEFIQLSPALVLSILNTLSQKEAILSLIATLVSALVWTIKNKETTSNRYNYPLLELIDIADKIIVYYIVTIILITGLSILSIAMTNEGFERYYSTFTEATMSLVLLFFCSGIATYSKKQINLEFQTLTNRIENQKMREEIKHFIISANEMEETLFKKQRHYLVLILIIFAAFLLPIIIKESYLALSIFTICTYLAIFTLGGIISNLKFAHVVKCKGILLSKPHITKKNNTTKNIKRRIYFTGRRHTIDPFFGNVLCLIQFALCTCGIQAIILISNSGEGKYLIITLVPYVLGTILLIIISNWKYPIPLLISKRKIKEYVAQSENNIKSFILSSYET